MRDYFAHVRIPLLLTALYAMAVGSFNELLELTRFGTLSFWGAAAYYVLHWRRVIARRRRALLQSTTTQQFLESEPTARDICILTYNIFLRPPFIKNNSDDLKNERLDEFKKVVSSHRFDIVCLQEMFSLGNLRLKYLLDHAYDEGYHFHCRSIAPSLLTGKFIDGGLLILSRFPIVEKGAKVFVHGNQIDAWAAKQVIHAKVQVSPTRFVHVFNTHMQASYYDTAAANNMVNDKMRSSQIAELAEFAARTTAGSEDPIIICGDLNVSAKEPTDETKETAEYA